MSRRVGRDRRFMGGGGGVQTPAQILGADLFAHHRNGDWVASGGLISQWTDASANAKHVTAAGATRPTETAAAFGALPGVTFTATTTFLQETAAGLSGNAPHSIFIYATASATPVSGGYATIGTSPGGTRATSTVGKWSASQRWYAGDDDLGGLITSTDATPRLYGKTYDGSVYTPRRSGAADGAPFAAAGALSLSVGHSLNTYTGNAAGATDVVIGEVVIASIAMSAGQVAALEAYFASVFGSI